MIRKELKATGISKWAKRGKKANIPRRDTVGKNSISLLRQNTKMRDSDQVGHQSARLWTVMLYYKPTLEAINFRHVRAEISFCERV